MKGLRHQIVTGGAYLIGRQTLGMALSLAGTIAITRLIGPTNYGLYAGAFAISRVVRR